MDRRIDDVIAVAVAAACSRECAAAQVDRSQVGMRGRAVGRDGDPVYVEYWRTGKVTERINSIQLQYGARTHIHGATAGKCAAAGASVCRGDKCSSADRRTTEVVVHRREDEYARPRLGDATRGALPDVA